MKILVEISFAQRCQWTCLNIQCRCEVALRTTAPKRCTVAVKDGYSSVEDLGCGCNQLSKKSYFMISNNITMDGSKIIGSIFRAEHAWIFLFQKLFNRTASHMWL